MGASDLQMKCACPVWDARRCADVRVGNDLRAAMDTEFEPNEEPCGCDRHVCGERDNMEWLDEP